MQVATRYLCNTMNTLFLRTAVLAAFLLLILPVSQAQPFLVNPANAPLSFSAMQRQFHDWSSWHRLDREKNWKYYKRWEAEMLLHTDGHGEPVAPELLAREHLRVHTARQQANARTTAASWYPLGPAAVPDNLTGYLEVGIGRINCIAFHPNDPSTYFVGVAQGGVWKTTDNGQSWTPLTDELPILRISDIAIDPNNTDVLYISVGDYAYIGFGLDLNGRKRNTHYGLGVYKSTDGGQTWAPTGLGFDQTQRDASLIRKVLVRPSDSNQLVACSASGMYTSDDAGANWTQVSDSLFWDLQQDPGAPDVLYAATGWVQNSNTGSAGVYKSTDFGRNWTLLNTGMPPRGDIQRVKLAIAPSDPQRIYAVTVDTQSGLYGFYVTNDGGTNWQYRNPGVNVLSGGDGTNPGGQGTYDLALLVNATDPDVVYVGGVNIWGSSDAARNFDPLAYWTLEYGPSVHADQHFFARQPLTGNIFVCNDGGLYRTADMIIHSWDDAINGIPWPTLWTNLSDGMATTSFYRISSSRNATGRLIAGAQDNSTSYYDGGQWYSVFGGDGMDNYLDPADDFRLIGSSQFGNFYESLDGGFSANFVNTNPNNEDGEWTTPFVADYNNPGVFYTGYYNVNRSDDNGFNWNPISSFPPNGVAQTEICALAVAPNDPDVLVAARRVRYEFGVNGDVFRTTNQGGSWTNITAGLPDSLYYTSVDIHPANAGDIAISLAGFAAGQKVYRSTDGGQSWQNVSFNLPNLPVNCVKYVPRSGQLMIASDVGVWTLDSGSVTWNDQSLGLPNVIVSDIEFNEVLNKVYVCTFGRGIWGSDLGLVTGSSGLPATAIDFGVYPSLNNGRFTLRLTESLLQPAAKVIITDIQGRQVWQEELNETIHEFNLGLAPGKYYIQVRTGDRVGVRSFIVG